MVIFLHGKDSFRRQKKLAKIAEEYRSRHSGISRDFFDLEIPGEFSRLKEFGGQMQMFGGSKLAVLRNAWEAEAPEMKEFLKKNMDSKDFTIVISEEKSAPAELKTLLKKSFLTEEFKELKGEEWRAFVLKEAARRNLKVSPRALSFLARTFEGDGWGLSNELDKLGLFSKNGSIDEKDLASVGGYAYESPNIFGFINAVMWNSPRFNKVTLLEELFIGQEEPVKIFNIMASLSRLPKDLLKKLAECDVKVKSGKLDYEEVLLDLALSG